MEPTSSKPTKHVLSDTDLVSTEGEDLEIPDITHSFITEEKVRREGLKRTFSESSNDSSRSSLSGSDNNIGTPVEENTSSWTENSLNILQITSRLSSLVPANKLIAKYILTTKNHESGEQFEQADLVKMEKMINNWIQMLNINTSPFSSINVDDISNVKSSLARSLIFSRPKPGSLEELQDLGTQKHNILNAWKPKFEIEKFSDLLVLLYNKFYTYGQEFTQHLIRICLSQENKKPLKEYMFEDLFRAFCSMFCFSSFKETEGETVKIGNKIVTSIPDITFPDFKESNEDLGIFAVCKVKKRECEGDMDSQKETRPQKQKYIKREKTIRHLDDKLLGQHGGDLLVYMLETQKNSLLGIVVQETNVTFSHMQCTKEQLKKIEDGKRIEPLEITYSRGYNFLRAEDRKVLIRAFLTLGLAQLTPYMTL